MGWKEGWDKRGQQNLFFLTWSGHSGQLSVSGGDQGQMGPSCGHWVRSEAGKMVLEYPEQSGNQGSKNGSPFMVASGCRNGWNLMSYQKVNTPMCCRKWGPLQGPKSGLLSNTQKRIVWGDTCWQNKRLLEEGTWAESRRVRVTRRTALPHGSQSWL